jgi:outer membrane protein assembly factor BamB
MIARLGLASTLAFALTAAAYADDWPNWRGPASTGVSSETGLPATWSDTQNIAWKAPIRGLGISSPIVWGARIFVTSQLGRGAARPGPRLYQAGDAAAEGETPLGATVGGAEADSGVAFLVTAFDRASGQRLWESQIEAMGPQQQVHEKHNLATPSPVTDGERIYAWFGTGQLVALDMNGRIVWQRHLGMEYSPFDIGWGHSSSPILHGDTLILLCYHTQASYLLGLAARTGEVRWKADREGGVISYSTPLVATAGSALELIVNSSQGLSGHDPATGEMLWQIEEANSYPIPVSVEHEGIVYASRGYRSGPYLALRPGGRGDVADSHVVWRVGTGAPYVSSILYYEGLIYMVGDVGVITVADAETGERVWQERVGGVFSASPVAGDGKVYLLSEGGETVVLAAGRSPRILARNKLTARQLASPAIAEGLLFIRSDDVLFAISTR